MRRICLVIALAVGLAMPAAAHTPEHCQPKRDAVYYAYLEVNRVGGSLDPSVVRLLSKEALAHVVSEFLLALTAALRANRQLQDCIDGK